MKLATGKTARMIRRREILSELATAIDRLAAPLEGTELPSAVRETIVQNSRNLLFELAELNALAEHQQKPRKRR